MKNSCFFFAVVSLKVKEVDYILSEVSIEIVHHVKARKNSQFEFKKIKEPTQLFIVLHSIFPAVFLSFVQKNLKKSTDFMARKIIVF